jgi:hypothetical protein
MLLCPPVVAEAVCWPDYAVPVVAVLPPAEVVIMLAILESLAVTFFLDLVRGPDIQFSATQFSQAWKHRLSTVF